MVGISEIQKFALKIKHFTFLKIHAVKEKVKNLVFGDINMMHDMLALEKLSKLYNEYVPWTSSSIRPSAIVKILNDIVINKRKHIIEFGSGISTLYIASILEREGGHLYSVEHDKAWIEIILDTLKKAKLDKVVTFIYAPLEQTEFALNNLKWYSEKSLLNSLPLDHPFELILVDGPLACTKELELSRYPAIPFLESKKLIAQNSSIFLDDIHRSGEKKIIKLWENNYPYRFVKHYRDGGVAISLNGHYYNII